MKNFNLILAINLFLSLSLFAQNPYFIPSNSNIPVSATGINSMDVESADLDNDGDLDLVIAGEFRRNLLLFNDGTGVFSEDSNRLFPKKNPGNPFSGEDSEDIVFADFDLDTDLDILFVSEDSTFHELLVNDGNGNFTFITFDFPSSLGEAVAVLDLNNDNYPDIIIGNNGQDQVFINNQDLTFTEDPSRWPVNSEGTQDLKMVDLDNDGDLDIIEGIDSGTNNILINTNGFFVDESNRLPVLGVTIETRKVSLGDINNDGFIDIFYSNVDFNGLANFQDRLFLNDGNGFFTDVTSSNFPVFNNQSLDAIFLDYDFDGDLDLITVGFLNAVINYHAFENDGNGNFTETTNDVFEPFALDDGIALHTADFNDDTFPDLYFGNFQETDDLLFYDEEALGFVDVSFENLIKVFPNPTSEVLIISSENIAIEVLKVYSVLGKKLIEQTIETNAIDVSGLSEGMYFLEIISGKGKSIQKFIKK